MLFANERNKTPNYVIRITKQYYAKLIDELKKGIIVGEEFGNCKKCKHIILVGHDSKNKIIHYDPRKSAFINYLLKKVEKE